MNIKKTLQERGERYGHISKHAMISQQWHKECVSPYIEYRSYATSECMMMIGHKIGRIVAGDHKYEDSYRDIIGYATLLYEDNKDTPLSLFYKNKRIENNTKLDFLIFCDIVGGINEKNNTNIFNFLYNIYTTARCNYDDMFLEILERSKKMYKKLFGDLK